MAMLEIRYNDGLDSAHPVEDFPYCVGYGLGIRFFQTKSEAREYINWLVENSAESDDNDNYQNKSPRRR